MRETIISAALDNLAVFPEVVAGSGGVRKITSFEEGWNAALAELESSILNIGIFLSQWDNFKEHYNLFDIGVVRVDYNFDIKVMTQNDVEVSDEDLPIISKLHERFGTEGVVAWEYTKIHGIPKKGYLEEFVDNPHKWKFNEAIFYLTKVY